MTQVLINLFECLNKFGIFYFTVSVNVYDIFEIIEIKEELKTEPMAVERTLEDHSKLSSK